MKRAILIIIVLLPYLLQAQPPVKKKKYPSLLWEISGNGLKKPSFLFGTMHVSSKMAFHLADSFYIGIRNADMVALETNPESWQEDMSKYDFTDPGYGEEDYGYGFNSYAQGPSDYFTINTLRFFKYDKKIERTLYSNPSTINNLLYRSYGNESSDFEEDTYLDMYIYQCGKKWGKKVAGVEKYGESMRLMAEAYKDAAKDKNRKDRSYDAEDGYSAGNLQEAYRTGNLDWLDSINRYNSFSSAFDEKFLYRRNEIQAVSIDSILRTGQSLFAGVGAAHLPGERGVIEMLRDKGYRVRPVKMGERDSQHKNQVERLRVPVLFATQRADDDMYKVDIPGKFYKFGEDPALEQRQYADMANGSYYMVTRIMTNAWMWGHNQQKVYRVIDSLLYENIPGKIISKTAIVRNGYTGIDLVNRTRRGDIQRYHIFITPFEIITFKMSGTGDYVRNGDEAKRFFGSIRLKEYMYTSVTEPGWKKFSPPFGGFAISFPHEPYTGNDGSWIYDAEDKSTQTHYRVIRTDIHNYRFVEEDTFDLGLMEESFASSDFISKQIKRSHFNYKGYPALDAVYQDKTGGIYQVRFLIQGPHYYTLVAHGLQELPVMKSFFNSFDIKPYIYQAARERKDTSLFYTVKSPVFPDDNKEKLNFSRYAFPGGPDDEEEGGDKEGKAIFRGKLITHDSTGENIFIVFHRMHRYTYFKDSSLYQKNDHLSIFGDTSWIVRSKKKYGLPDKTAVWEYVATDSGSSRTIWSKTFIRDDIGYSLVTASDTLTAPSEFVRSFFETFSPVYPFATLSPFKKKSDHFFTDLMETDTNAHQRAVSGLYMVRVDSTDFSPLKKAIASVNWSEKKYLDTKKMLIDKLDDIRTRQAADHLKELYYAAGDTVEIQYTVLETLLQQKNRYAYSIFRDIMTNEPPVLNTGSNNKWPVYQSPVQYQGKFNYDNGNFIDELHDTLLLTKTILPDLLPLLNLDDYKFGIMRLLGEMVDSNLVAAKEYDSYFSKFFLEARQELKKQSIAEKKKAIDKAEKDKDEKKANYFVYENPDKDQGNERLNLYATLLIPFWENRPNVQAAIYQMLGSGDNRLKYNTFMLLLRKNKPYPDSLLNYFARMDDYRYELYTDLNDLDKKDRFPAFSNNQQDLGKGKLINLRSYDIPDSLVFIDKLTAEIDRKKGYVYFYKYKNKKDDMSWKLATVGLLSEDLTRFELDDTEQEEEWDFSLPENLVATSKYDLTGFSNTRLLDDQSVSEQLKKELRKMLYSRRKSAKEFYEKSEHDYDDATVAEIEEN